MSSRAAGGLPIIKSKAAAFSGPVSVLSPLIAASSMASLLRSLRGLFKRTAGHNLEQRHAETLGRVIDHDNFSARDHGAVHHHIDRIADPLIKRDDGAARELHEPGDRQR